MTNRTIFGVGYGGRGISEITDILSEMYIDEVADIRGNTASSRRPEFRAKALAQRLYNDAEIAYEHYPALGNPKDTRRLMRDDSPLKRGVAGWRYAREVLDSEPGDHALVGLAHAAACRRVAVMCACRDRDRCHRRYVLDRLQERYGFEPVEL